MRILVIGKGGREHALVWALGRSPRVERVFCAPGNAGTEEDGVNVPIDPVDFDRLVRFVRKERVELTVVGPEEPLARGIVNYFQKEGLRIFGPTREAAQIEASKVFSKNLMRHADVPTAEARTFDHPDHARPYIESRAYPLVVKADGLAAGKGVIVCSTTEEALTALKRIMVDEEFGREAGRQVVVEKRLRGEELSLHALVSGRTILALESSQDHKPAYDGDTGPNTGGMGAYCPAPLATPRLLNLVDREILVSTVHAMKRGRTPFRGILYTGLMVTSQGPRVLEFNCRFGDPEAQPMLFRLQTDLVDLLEAVIEERLAEFEGQLQWDPRPAVSVVLASKGYPGPYQKGIAISGLEEVARLPDVKVFHAGTRREGNLIVTDGGRILSVTALGTDLEEARDRAYQAIDLLNIPGAFYRRDIASKALQQGGDSK